MGHQLATRCIVPRLRPGHLVSDPRQGRAPGQNDLRRMPGHRTMPSVGDLLRRTLRNMGRIDRQRTPAGTTRLTRASLPRLRHQPRPRTRRPGPVPLVPPLATQTAPKGHLVALDDDMLKKAQKGRFWPVFCKPVFRRNPAVSVFFPPKTARLGCVKLRLPGSPPSTARKAA
jgi:hypothetical protein